MEETPQYCKLIKFNGTKNYPGELGWWIETGATVVLVNFGDKIQIIKDMNIMTWLADENGNYFRPPCGKYRDTDEIEIKIESNQIYIRTYLHGYKWISVI